MIEKTRMPHDGESLLFMVEGRVFKSSKQYITGAEIKELAGIPMETELYLHIRAPYNDEPIGNEQEVDLALPGIEGFFTKKPLRFTVDGQQYCWPKQFITGADIRKIASIPDSKELYLDVPGDWEDNLINDNERVDLARPGREKFETRDRSKVTIWVNSHPHVYTKDTIGYEEVVTLAFGKYNPTAGYTVVYGHGPSKNQDGLMSKGDVVYVQHKMEFYVTESHLS